MRVLILTQTISRDGWIDQSIANHLKKLGHTAEAIQFIPHGRREVLKYKPHVVVVPEAGSEYCRDFCIACRRMGIKVAVRRCEPGLTKHDYDEASEDKRRLYISSWDYFVDLELVWSEPFKEILMGRSEVLNKNVKVIGGIAFDPYFPIKKREANNPGKKHLVLAASWDYADRTSAFSVPEAPFGSPLHKYYFDKGREGRMLWIDEILDCYDDLKDEWDITLKTHPVEAAAEYEHYFKDTDIKVIQLPSARETLEHTDLLVHPASTMAIEAHLMGIPALRFGNCGNKGYLLASVSTGIKSLREVNDATLGKSNANQDVIDQLSKDFFGPIDGNACERAAKAISELEPMRLTFPSRWPDSDTNYEIAGTSKYPQVASNNTDIGQCPACKNVHYFHPAQRVGKCPWCGAMVIRPRKGQQCQNQKNPQ